MPDTASRRSPPIVDSPGFRRFALPAVLLTFTMLALTYMGSDIWFDELMTIYNYGFSPRVSRIFVSYPVANNHMLYSALLWLWLKVTPSLTEQVIRLPGYVLGLATLTLLYRIGQHLLSRDAGFFLALLMALSPVYLSFFWQIRGYGLSMLLATAATWGALLMAHGETRRGLAWYAPAALLLPGVLPTNLIVTSSLWLFVTAARPWRTDSARRQLALLTVLGAMSIGGMAIYLPVWKDFLRVTRETEGWESGAAVVGNWLLALLAHAGVFASTTWLMSRRTRPGPVRHDAGEDGVASLRPRLRLLLLCCLGPLVAVALLRSPFPRAFLGYLPPLTICALAFYRPMLVRHNVRLGLLLFVLIASTLSWTHLSAARARQELLAGHWPHDLLKQYYTRNVDLSVVLRQLHLKGQAPPETWIFLDVHLYYPAGPYWAGVGGDKAQLRCLNCGGEQPPGNFQFPQFLIAYNLQAAMVDYSRLIRAEITVEALDSPTDLGIYRINRARQQR